MEWYDAPEHDGQFSFAGYRDTEGNWQDVEAGDTPMEFVPEADIVWVDDITIHYTSPAGDDIYFTIHGPFDDWDAIWDYIDYALEPYGVA